MTFRTLIHRNLRFHWRSHLGVVLGAAIGAAALTGALIVGDSVRGSLKTKAFERLAGAELALNSGDRLFTRDLAQRMSLANSNRLAAAGAPTESMLAFHPSSFFGEGIGTPILSLPASISRQDGSARANHVSVFGVDPMTWPALRLHGNGSAEAFSERNEVWINQALADQLEVTEGDQVIVRINKPSTVGLDAAIASRTDATVALRVSIGHILPSYPGNLSLLQSGTTPMNIFAPFPLLEKATGLSGRGNVLLLEPALRTKSMTLWERYRHRQFAWRVLGDPHPLRNFDWLKSSPGQMSIAGTGQESAALAAQLMKAAWSLNDTEAEIVPCTNASDTLELRTSRVFLDPPIERAALVIQTNARPILTYIASLLTSGTNQTPYSMVTAAGAPWTPPDLMDDEIVLTDWLADDLDARPGDAIALVFYDPESGTHLTEKTNTLRVHSIVPLQMPWADQSLMPPFPGIEEAESTAEWDTAFPLKYKVRSKDDDYWRDHRGTPKAFVTLAAGKQMWANRFGNLTAIRFAGTPDDTHALETRLLAHLDPTELGFRFEPVREQALKAAAGSQDFGGLFIGFSFFLVAAALILMSLLFQFGLEQRATELGTLLALGFTRRQTRRLLLGEGAALAFIGGLLGMLGGVAYAKGMLFGLQTVWRDAIGGSSLQFHVTPQSLGIGLLASVGVAVVTIGLALRRQARQPTTQLLTADSGMRNAEWGRGTGGAKARLAGMTALALAAALVGWALTTGETTNAGVFFGAGSLVLIGGVLMTNGRLQSASTAAQAQSTTRLAFRGLARRRSRSLATMTLVASGSFLILSIGVFRLDARRDATQHSAGTGGFALVGESTSPIVKDLNTSEGREFFALDETDLRDVNVVAFRVKAGDDASCLNLNRAQQPRLLGVQPNALTNRFTFAKVAKGLERSDGWRLLNAEGERSNAESESRNTEHHTPSTDPIPAIGDLNSILWAMGKKVGDTVDYVDGNGQPFQVQIVGAVANSLLQGNLIIDERAFVRRFPDAAGYGYFLIDAPADHSGDVREALSRALQDYGVEIQTASSRLNEFNAVQNTYLGTFQLIGGLGLMLGTAGLGIVVLRNVLERRAELAVLMAVGFRKRKIERLILIEHVALLGLGVALGFVAAAVAVLPTLLAPGSALPYGTLVPTLLGVGLNGLLWTWIATRLAIRGNLLAALRNE